MKMIVCVKQVPGGTEVRLDPKTHTIIREGQDAVINPFDYHALEEAVRIKEKLGGHITTLSMGIPATEQLLRDTLSRGADEALLLSDRAFAGSDTLATAYTLTLGIREIGDFDLILCGKMAVDGDTAQIGPELGEMLGIPHITDVRTIVDINERELRCIKVMDNGEQELKVKLPALITVLREINAPRLPSISSIKESLIANYRRLNAAELKADLAYCGLEGSPTQVVKTFIPQNQGKAREITGSPAKQGQEIVALIRETLTIRRH